MRVLFLAIWYPNSQNPVSGTFVHEQAEAVRARGIEVRVMQPIPLTPFPLPQLNKSYRDLAALTEEGNYGGHPIYRPRYLTLPAHRLFERVGDWMFKAIRERVATLHHEWPFEIIHAHATYPCGYAANRCRDELLPQVKVLHTIHRTCIVDAPNYNRTCFEKVRAGLIGADLNVFVSREGLRLGLEITDGQIEARSRYLTNGVSVAKFALSEADEAELHGLRQKHAQTWNLVFVGYLKEVKGIKELLPAVARLVAQGRRRLRLFLVGKNELGSYVQETIASLGLQDHVVLVGPVPHARVKLWMRFASAFILPSHSEGTPTVLFEALYMGAPSIFTDVGGVGDIVKNGREALVIAPRSVPAIERAIATLMDDDELCAALRQRGHALISSSYTWDINARSQEQIYRQLLGAEALENA